MRRIRIIVSLIFVLSCAAYIGYHVQSKMIEDHTPPVISCDTDEIQISVQMDAKQQEEALLAGMTASDDRDGDLTSSIRVASMSHFLGDGKRTVSYVVFDKSNQAGVYQRTVQYTDYTAPKVHMYKPLRCRNTQSEKLNWSEFFTAEDCLDGDLSNQVHVELSNYYMDNAGEYPLSVQVSNSAGDTCVVPMSIFITDDSDRTEREKIYPLLNEYIVYTPVGVGVDVMAYYAGFEMNGNEFLIQEEPERAEEIRAGLWCDPYIDYYTPGVYPVDIHYTNAEGTDAFTRMYIVVEAASAGTMNDSAAEAQPEQTENTEESAEQGQEESQDGQ